MQFGAPIGQEWSWRRQFGSFWHQQRLTTKSVSLCVIPHSMKKKKLAPLLVAHRGSRLSESDHANRSGREGRQDDRNWKPNRQLKYSQLTREWIYGPGYHKLFQLLSTVRGKDREQVAEH